MKITNRHYIRTAPLITHAVEDRNNMVHSPLVKRVMLDGFALNPDTYEVIDEQVIVALLLVSLKIDTTSPAEKDPPPTIVILPPEPIVT